MGRSRSAGGLPGTVMWPPAFALRGPECVFGVAAFAPRDRFTQADGGGLRWRPAGLLGLSHPDLFAAFIPVRHRLTTGGRLPGLPGPGVSTPRAVRRPHAPVIPQAAGMSRARVRATIPGRRFPLDRTPPHVDGPGARRPPPATGWEALYGRFFLRREDWLENPGCRWKGRGIFSEPDYRSANCKHSVTR